MRIPYRLSCALLSCLVGSACTALPPSHGTSVSAPPPPASVYVAMGSSYAAGPGITTPVVGAPKRCARSNDNYAHLLARKLDLQLTDVSCSGATTQHVLAQWEELAPQIDAVTPATEIVTVTIGGNDVGYFGMLWTASCTTVPSVIKGRGFKCPAKSVEADAWMTVETGLRTIVAEVRRRSPAARLIFVDYLSVLPEQGGCASTPMGPEQARAIVATAQRLADLTARIAKETHSEVIKASALSSSHNACGDEPWVTGFVDEHSPSGFVPYHPNHRGMVAVANALEKQLLAPAN